MNKIACDVIKDLLPLYVDDVCSEKSKDLIETHLAGCEDCQKYYEALQGSLPDITMNKNDATNSADVNFINNISKKLHKELTINRIVLIVSTCILMSLIFLVVATSDISRYDIRILDNRLSVSDVEITELYELENGDIYFTLESDKKISWSYLTAFNYDDYLGDDTEFFSSAKLTYSWWDEYIEKIPCINSCSFVCPKSLWSINEYDQDKLRENSVIYYEGKDYERLTIWTEYQDLEKAPKDIETKVDEYRTGVDDTLGFMIYNYE